MDKNDEGIDHKYDWKSNKWESGKGIIKYDYWKKLDDWKLEDAMCLICRIAPSKDYPSSDLFSKPINKRSSAVTGPGHFESIFDPELFKPPTFPIQKLPSKKIKQRFDDLFELVIAAQRSNNFN